MESWSDTEPLLDSNAAVDQARTVMRDDAANIWLRSPNPNLGYERPLDLIAAGDSQRMIDLLFALAEGVTT